MQKIVLPNNISTREQMKGIDKYLLEVDEDQPYTYQLTEDIQIRLAPKEGSHYEMVPYFGVARAVPSGSPYKIGDTLVIEHSCSDHKVMFNGKMHYSATVPQVYGKVMEDGNVMSEHYIVGHAKVDETSFGVYSSKSKSTTEIVACSRSEKWDIYEGDVVKYQAGRIYDVELNGKTFLFLRPDFTVALNGEAWGKFCLIESAEGDDEWVMVNGVRIQRKKTAFAGKLAFGIVKEVGHLVSEVKVGQEVFYSPSVKGREGNNFYVAEERIFAVKTC